MRKCEPEGNSRTGGGLILWLKGDAGGFLEFGLRGAGPEGEPIVSERKSARIGILEKLSRPELHVHFGLRIPREPEVRRACVKARDVVRIPTSRKIRLRYLPNGGRRKGGRALTWAPSPWKRYESLLNGYSRALEKQYKVGSSSHPRGSEGKGEALPDPKGIIKLSTKAG